MIIAAVFEFLGAFALGATVTNTIRKKITDYSAFEGEGDVLMLGMFCSLCSAALWLYIATKYQLPVSTTQSIVGAIIGFVLASKGPQAVVWEAVMYIVIFWVASPCLAAIGSAILFLPSRQWLFRRTDSYEKTLLTWPLWVFLVVFIMTLFLMLKGLKRIDIDFTLLNATWIAAVCGAVVALIAWGVFIRTGIVDRHVHKYLTSRGLIPMDTENNNNNNKIMMVPTKDEDETEEDEQEDENGNNNTKKLTPKTEHAEIPKNESKLRLIAGKATYGLTIDITDKENMNELERAIHEKSEKFDIKTERAFSWLQVCTASLDIFAHGSNDVANAVAPFAAMVAIYESQSIESKAEVPWWILFIGAIGMTIGLATYGYKIMQCLGVRMGAMSSTRGYCIELSSALVVILASYYGFPASTTHAQVGATVGVGLCELGRGSESTLKWTQVINWKLLAQVFLGWILTLVVAGATCAALFSFMAFSPYAGNASYICRE